jgi:hypothetical protein
MKTRETVLVPVSSLIASCLVLLALALVGCGHNQPGANLVGAGLGEIRGIVTINGNGVEAPVSLELRVGDQVKETTQSGAAGAFGFKDVSPGAYELFIAPPAGYSPDAPLKNPIPVRVDANRTAEVVVPLVQSSMLPQGSIKAYVTGDGASMAGVTVTVYQNNTSTAIAAHPTDEHGSATFALDAGLYGMGIEIPAGYELESPAENPVNGVWTQSDDSSAVNFDLRSIGGNGQLEVWVYDPDSLNVDPNPPVFTVNVYDSGAGSLVSSGSARLYQGATFELAAGTYSVGIIMPAGYELWPAEQQNPQQGVIVRSHRTAVSRFEVRKTQ